MARWLKTSTPHSLIQHQDVDKTRLEGQLLVWSGSLYRHMDAYEATKPKQIDYEASAPDETLNIPLDHPNPSRDRLIQILKYVGRPTRTTTLYDFIPEETSRFNFDSRFVTMDGSLYLQTDEDFNMSPERFFWTRTIDTNDYAEIDILTIKITT